MPDKQYFEVVVSARRVPGVLWTKPHAKAAQPLVLVGHGGSQHKEHETVLDIVESLTVQRGIAVACIDGPVHGARRVDGGLVAQDVAQDFRELWRSDPHIEEMVEDWRGALDWLVDLPSIDSSHVGWFGVSMGTAYGVPLVAAEQRIRAAVLGMWGSSHPHGTRLLELASGVNCPVLFHRKQNDAIFNPEGQEELFNALNSAEKELKVYPGGHGSPAGAELHDAASFIASKLHF